MNTRNYFILSLIASFTIGLAPFKPEPHLFGKLRWLLGGGQDMQMMDYLDLLMHGLPWLLLVYFGYQLLFSKAQKESKGALMAALKNPSVKIIDVREANEFNSGHYPKALNFPLSTMVKQVDELRSMDGPYVLYCRSGMRSGQAKKLLEENGLIAVHNAKNKSNLKKLISAS